VITNQKSVYVSEGKVGNSGVASTTFFGGEINCGGKCLILGEQH